MAYAPTACSSGGKVSLLCRTQAKKLLFMVRSIITKGPSPLPPIRKFALSEGRVVAFAEISSQPVVLLIHGNSSAKEIFCPQIGILRRLGFGILAPDLPGHGRSDNARRPTHTYSIPGYAGALQAILDQLALSAVHVVGWSLGGHVGLELLAIDRRVRSLMITGAPPVTPGPDVIKQAFLPFPAISLAAKRVLSADETRVYGECLVGGKRYVTSGVLNALRRTDGRARYWMVKNALRGIGTDEVRTVRENSCPLAVVHGRHDVFINRRYVESLNYRNLWRGRVQVVNAGHAPHWQRPRLFNKLLASFLKDVIPN
jgi:pimeloyl-ACP methyl ester carboxylesterase